MQTRDVLYIINSSGPFITALFCLALIIMRYNERDDYTRTKLLKLLVGYYLTIICVSFTALSFLYLRSIYVVMNSISMLSILFSIVIVYHIIHVVTAIGTPKPFSFIHYLAPIIITLAQYTWSYFFLLSNDSDVAYGNKWFLAVSSFKLGVWLIYGTVYSLCGLRMIFKYKKIIVCYSADEDRSSVRWLYAVIISTIALIPPTFLYFSLRNEVVLLSVSLLMVNLALQLNVVILTYNMFTENYVIMYPVGTNPDADSTPLKKIDKEHFERFMREKKPYLNPALRITDLMRELCTNRSYFSGFINQTYSMSFSRYINTCRLRELKRMQSDPKLADYDEESLIIMAGFRSIRGYRRFTKQKEQ